MKHQAQKIRRFHCHECTIYLVTGLLAIDHQVQHGIGKGDMGGPPLSEPYTHRVYLNKVEIEVALPVEGCLGRDSSWTNLRVHFVC